MLRLPGRTAPLLTGLAMSMAMFLPALALGAEEKERFRPHVEITPFAGYRFGGQFKYAEDTPQQQNLELEDAASFGFDFGLYRDGISLYEFLYSNQSTDLQAQGLNTQNLQLRTEYYQVGGTLLYPQGNGLTTWFSFTAGATRFVPSGTINGESLDSESAFSLGMGLGLRLPMNDHFALTGGVRGYLTFIDTSTSLFCISSGGAACSFRITGSSFFQFEGLLGVTMIF